MPIPRTKLLETQEPLEERILQFLASKPDQAFNIYEIMVGVGDYDSEVIVLTMLAIAPTIKQEILKDYLAMLGNLRASGRIVAAEWQGTTHYAVKTT